MEKITGKSWENHIHSPPLTTKLLTGSSRSLFWPSLQSGSFYRGKKPDFLQFTLRKGRLSKRDSRAQVATKADDDTTKATTATWKDGRNHHTQREIFCCCVFHWKLCLADLLAFCFWSILRCKRFKSFSFGQDLVCAESRHAAAGMTTTTTTAVSFLRVSKHLDGRPPWRKWSRRLSFRQEVPAPEKGGVASFGVKQRPFSWCHGFLQQFSSSFAGKEGAFQLHLYHSW